MKRFLLHHNGEADVGCPIAFTDGLIALLEHFRDERSPELERILEHSKEGIDGEFAIGPQIMSEIQGGSNIPLMFWQLFQMAAILDSMEINFSALPHMQIIQLLPPEFKEQNM
ncbi:hypothetical protein NDK43_22905 [Neobacillus pocheonensis]|uniref:Uncharacterized protein n=1 Tax=Neobacillus pocheonensis TaxID=363869 RepID=A0ABT0WEC5_9BACI|nr:hypothetical protein [Neobacillus pocheonensis]